MLGPTSPRQVTDDSAVRGWLDRRAVFGSATRSASLLPIVLSVLVVGVALHADVSSAATPFTSDTLVQQGDKLTSGEPEVEARFGTSAALSADGSTLLIGGPQDESSQGAVWFFVRSGSSWTLQGPKQTAGEAPGKSGLEECGEESTDEAGECAFGNSVALSADGNTALVGDPSSNATPGAAWVFTRSGTTWTRGPALRGGGGGDEGRLGKSVALSADGDTALIGNPVASFQRGEALVFTRSGNTWTQQAVLTDSEASPLAHFGRSVALSGDGDTALIGGPGDSGYEGAAWAFRRSGTTSWSQIGGKITGTRNGERIHFGKAVSLSGDGTTALVGAPDYGEQSGAVWALARSGPGFVQQGALTSGPAAQEDLFGSSVALSADGNDALVGAPRAEAGVGSVTAWTRSSDVWTPRGAVGGTESVGKGWTGASAALSSDGVVAAIGAPHDAKRAGAAWVFALAELQPPVVTNVVPGRGTTDGGTEVEIRGANFNTVREVHFGALGAASFVFVTAARIKAVTPPEPAGKVDVTVTTSAGTSAVSRPADVFVFEGAPNGPLDPPPPPVGISTGASGGVQGSSASASAACRVSLRSKRAVVALHRSVAIRLLRTGAGPCRGTLTLRYRQKTTGKRFKLRNIGSARFAISPGRSLVVKVTLNGLGRRLFRTRHGKLNVSAAVVRTSPRPVLARTASVRLSVKKTPKR